MVREALKPRAAILHASNLVAFFARGADFFAPLSRWLFRWAK